MNTYPLKIGLVIDDVYLPAWQMTMLRRIKAQAHAQIKLVLITVKPKTSLLSLVKLSFFKNIRVLESNLFETTQAADQLISINELWHDDPVKLNSTKAKELYFSEEVNLVINLSSSSELPSYLAKEANYGVWQYFYNSHLERSADWAGLKEFNLGENGALTGVSVNSPYFENSVYLWISYTSRQCLLSKTHDNLLWKMVEFIPVLCAQASQFESGKAFIQNRFLKTLEDKKNYLDKINNYSLITTNFLAFLFGFLYAHLNRLFNKIALDKQWVLLKTEQSPVKNFQKIEKSTLLYQSSEGFVADPCLVEENGESYVFFEEYVKANKRGRLVCAKLQDLEAKRSPFVILEKDYHLSYPFVFKSEGVWYLIPESAENHTVDLYKCLQFPQKWEFVKSLLTGVDAYDATLHQHLGRWWMFVNLRPHNSISPNELLYLFSAESLLAEHWQAHPDNPIIQHADKARSAGALFEVDGVIYRPSQNCAGSYGRGLNLNAIIEWNEKTYKEQTIDQCIPKNKSLLDGMHSLSCLGSTIISDGIYTRKRWRKA